MTDRPATRGAGDDTDAIERAMTSLVQQAPAIDPAAVDELCERLRQIGSPLALSIARVLELVGEQLVDPGIALPPLAMACATLGDGIRGKLSARELEAARYEIETLMPMPDHARGTKIGRSDLRPDVPTANLIRGLRPRT